MDWLEVRIGTKYFGKRDTRVREKTCDTCGYCGEHRSFDARPWVTVNYVPFLPLRRQRIIEWCPRCGQHQSMPLNAWHRMTVRVLADALHACRQDPVNPRLAVRAVQTALEYPDHEGFMKLASSIEQSFPDDAAIQARLGFAYVSFQEPEAAERAFIVSLSIEHDWDIQEALAVVLIENSRPQDAWPFLQHVLDQRWFEKKHILFLAVECYQSWGMHDEALRVLDDCLRAFPEIQENEEYRSYRRISEKHRSTGKRIKSPHFESAR